MTGGRKEPVPTYQLPQVAKWKPLVLCIFFFFREFSKFHFIYFFFIVLCIFKGCFNQALQSVNFIFLFFFNFYFTLGYSLLYCVSFRHTQSNSVTHGYVSILFQILSPYMLLQSIKQDSPQFLISETFFLHSAL